MRKIVITSLALLGGCMVGPKYVPPEVVFAPEFNDQIDGSGDVIDLKVWWQQFDDPVLNEMVDEAIENNYELLIAYDKIEEVRARYNLASANLWPEIDVNGSMMRYKISQTVCDLGGSFCPPVQNLFQMGFNASWEIDLFGRLRSLKNQAFFELQASQENLRGVYVSLLADLTRVYADFRALQQRIELTMEQIRVNRDLLSLAEVRYRAGLQSEISPLQSKAVLDELEASLPPLQAQEKIALYSIAVLLGRQPEGIPEEWLAPRPIPKAAGRIPVGLPSDLLRRRPDIRKAEREIAAANANVGATIALLFPDFSLTAGFGYESARTGNFLYKRSKYWNVGPNVAWPMIDFGRIRSEIDFSKAVEREALLNYEQTVLKALEEVEDTLVAYAKEEIRLEKLMEKVDDLRKSRDLTAALFRAGLDSWTNLLDAEEQVLVAEQVLLSSQQTLSEDLMAVYKSLGGDWSCSTMP